MPEPGSSTEDRPALSPPWDRRLTRHIIAVLIFKALMLALLFSLFFAPRYRPAVDAEAAARHLTTPAVTEEPASGT